MCKLCEEKLQFWPISFLLCAELSLYFSSYTLCLFPWFHLKISNKCSFKSDCSVNLISLWFSRKECSTVSELRVALLPTHSSFCQEEFDSQLGSMLWIAPELHSITHLTHRTSVYIHCTACTSLFGWPLNFGYQLAYSLSRLRCWRHSYVQNAGGILTKSLGRLILLAWLRISRQSHMTTEAPVREVGSWYEKPHVMWCVLSVCLLLPLPTTQQLLGRLLNGIPLHLFSGSNLAYSNWQISQPNGGVAKQPLEKTQRLGADPKAAVRAGSHECLELSSKSGRFRWQDDS